MISAANGLPIGNHSAGISHVPTKDVKMEVIKGAFIVSGDRSLGFEAIVPYCASNAALATLTRYFAQALMRNHGHR